MAVKIGLFWLDDFQQGVVMYQLVLKHYAAIASLVAALLYVFGMSVHWGYLDYWSLAPSIFPIHPYEALYTASVVLIGAFIPIVVKLVTVIVVSVPLIIVFAVVLRCFLVKSKKIEAFGSAVNSSNEKMERLKNGRLISSFRNLKLNFYETVVVKSLGAFVVITVIGVLIIGYGSNMGVESGRKQRLRLSNGQGGAVTSWELKSGQSYSGHIITCSENYCAYLLGEKVVVLPNEDVKKVWRDAPVLNQ